VTVNNSTNINKTNNNISFQVIEYKKGGPPRIDVGYTGIGVWKTHSCGGIKPVNWNWTVPILWIGSPMATQI